MVKQTSLQALAEITASGKALTQAQYIWLACGDCNGMTRQEISRSTGYSINAVCGRVSELLSKGRMKVGITRACRITGKQVETLYSIN